VLADNIGGVAACIAAVATCVNTVLAGRIHHVTTKTLSEVVTLNGKTIGNLADNAEGRRIATEIPKDQQTSHDKRYVEAVEAIDHPVTPPKGEP